MYSSGAQAGSVGLRWMSPLLNSCGGGGNGSGNFLDGLSVCTAEYLLFILLLLPEL